MRQARKQWLSHTYNLSQMHNTWFCKPKATAITKNHWSQISKSHTYLYNISQKITSYVVAKPSYKIQKVSVNTINALDGIFQIFIYLSKFNEIFGKKALKKYLYA